MKGKDVNAAYDSIRQVWETDPTTKIHGERKDKYQERRKTRQRYNNLVGNLSAEDLEDLETEEME